MKISLNIFTIILLCCFNISAQINVKVLNGNTLEPIEQVLIYSETKHATTNNNGTFTLSEFSEVDSLTFSHVAYKKITLAFGKILNDKKVLLYTKNIKLNEVLVSETQGKTRSEIREVITREEISDKAYLNIGELLKKKSSLNIKDYGSYVGIKTVSSRGLSSENTLVLFNEAKINDLRTGSFDLSRVSSFAVDKIDYVKNSSERNYAGGVLKIYTGSNTSKNKLSFGTGYTSNNLHSFFSKLNKTAGNFSIGLNAERSYSANKYNYIFEGNEYSRSNAHFSKSFINADVKYNTENAVIKLYNHYSFINNGIPGYVVTNNTSSSRASSNNISYLSILNSFINFSEYLLNKTTLSFHKQKNILSDPQREVLFTEDESKSNLHDFSFNNSAALKLNSFLLTAGYEFTHSSIDSLSAFSVTAEKDGDFRRASHVVYTSAEYGLNKLNGLLKSFSLSGGVSYSINDDNFFEGNNSKAASFNVGLRLVPGIVKRVALTANYISNERMPTFNEAYYSNLLSNTKLKNEKYQSFDFGISTSFPDLLISEISINYFLIDGTDKIIWVPTRLALQIPKNISKVRSDGVELWIKHKSKFINLSVNYNYTRAINKTKQSSNDFSYDKFLIYSPEHRLNVNLSFVYNNFNISAYNSFVSKRFYTADNNPDNSLPAYFITDITAGYKFKLGSVTQILSVSALNIFNEEYFIIQSYPMPLRSFMINYQIELL